MLFMMISFVLLMDLGHMNARHDIIEDQKFCHVNKLNKEECYKLRFESMRLLNKTPTNERFE